MAVYHVVYEKFWTDADVSECTAHEKLFLLTALTNPQVHMCGCYEITVKQIAEYMSLEVPEIEQIIEKFEKRGKFLVYDRSTKELFLKNWYKHNWTDSPYIDKTLREEISEIKNEEFKKILTERYNARKTVKTKKSTKLDGSYVAPATIDAVIEPVEQISFPGGTEESFCAPVVEEVEEDSVPYKKIVDMWNDICVSFGRVRAYSGKRKTSISARWREFGDLDIFRQVFENTENSNFMKGGNDRGWKADFDWVMCPTNFQKVLENKYDNRKMKWNNQSDDDGWSYIKSVASGGSV
jgi:hypothetical protein